MPTVIDALIVELQLDPKKFTDGQRQAADSLRRMERDADKSARTIGDAGSKGFTVFFANIDKNFGEVNKHLSVIAAQSRRTGRSIADGGREGAAGLTSLTTAALGAFSAMKALQGLYHEVTKTAAGGAAIGRIVPETGSRSPWVQQFANAAGIAVNANPAAVMENLRSIEMDLQTFANRGEMSGNLREMTIGGVNVSQTDTAETLMRKIEANLAGKRNPAEAAMWAQRYGLDRDVGRFARQGPGAVDTAMAQVRDRNLTEEQIKQHERLQAAQNKAAQAYDHLWKVISADLGNSGLSRALEEFAKLADEVSNSETAVHGLEIAIGVGLVGGIGGLIRILQALGALPAWRALVGMAALGGGGAGLLRFLGPAGAAAAVMLPGTAGNQAEVDAERKLFGQARAAAGVAPGRSTASDPRGMEPIIRAAAAKYGVDPEIAMRVARSEGLGVFLGDHGKSGGSFQLYTGGGLGNQFQRETGLNPLDPKNEAATVDWAMKNVGRTGWGPYHGAARSGISNWQGIGVGGNATAAVAGAVSGDDVKNAYWQYNREHPQATLTWPEFVKELQAARARQSAGTTSATTNNDIDHTTNIGTMEIHTQANDGHGVYRAFDEAKRKTMANQVNTGLE